MYNVEKDISGIKQYSYSSLNSFNNCPLSYWYNYIQHEKRGADGFSAYGSLVHEILDKHLKGELMQFEMANEFEDEYPNRVPDGIYLKLDGYTRDLTEPYKDQAIRYFNKFNDFKIGDEVLQIVETEKKFEYLITIKDKTIILNGILDVVAKDSEDNYYIIDFKSKGMFKDENELNNYATQLYLYSIYIKQKYGKFPKELWFEQFRVEHTEKIQFNEDDFNKMLDWVYETIENIEQEQIWSCKDFHTEDSKKMNNEIFFCRNLCSFSSICKEWAGVTAKEQEF